MNYSFYTLILCFVLFSCKDSRNKSSDWIILEFKVFTINTPPNWTIIKEKGIDSYVGGLTNGVDSLYFDYGWYSAEVGEEDPLKHKFAMDTVNGKIASIVIPKEEAKGQIAMSILKLKDKNNKFIIGGTNVSNTNLILKIFKSIRFEDSDTSKNSNLTITKFSNNSMGTGKSLFMANCASCHSRFKDATGPSLKDITNNRENEWIYNFLTNRSKVLSKKQQEQLKSKWQFECMSFPTLTREQVNLIIDYAD